MNTAALAASRTPLPDFEVSCSKAGLSGSLILPNDPGYEEARKVWNGMVDKRPAMIIYCSGQTDVVEAVKFARSRNSIVSVRAGGHNIAGCSMCDDGVVIDLSRMKRIEVDPAHRVAWAEAGLTLGEFDRATQPYGLATTMGVNSDTGIAGLTLGGGFGKLGRKFGLTCDNLLGADVVTADGELVRASASENADLFWAIRGGGGNFGIVTRFEYRLHPIGARLFAGSLVYDYRHAREAMRFYSGFSRNAHDELSLDASLVTTAPGERFFGISACYFGAVEEGERALEPLRAFGSPAGDAIAPVPYLYIQAGNDTTFPRGRRYYWKAQFLRELTDDAIDALLSAYAQAPAVASLLVLQHLGGAIARVSKSETAYVNRDALYDCFPISIWDDPADDEKNVEWARDAWNAVRPFSTGGVYVNNLGEEGDDRIRAAYGENYPRLLALKRKYDPTNFFRSNQNIAPTNY
jgi:FAD binding domain/Berberine and berberine like